MKSIFIKNKNNNISINDTFNSKEKSEHSKNIGKKIKKKRNININYKSNIFLFKLLICNILIPIYLANKNSFKFRKLNSEQIITIEFFGNGTLSHLSSKSEILPKYIYINNKTFTYYKYKSLIYGRNKTWILKMKFNIFTFFKAISFDSLFENLNHITKVDLSHFTDKVSTTRNMFKNCKNLEYVNFGNFDTSYSSNMEYMFYGTNLKYLDLSTFDTSKVTTMEYMFAENNNLLYLNLNKFNTKNVKIMKNMFYNCKSLMYLNLYSLTEYSSLTYDGIFTGIPEDIIYCINEEKAPNIASSLKDKSTKNLCEDDCFQGSQKLIPYKNSCIDNCTKDDTYIYEYYSICYNYSFEQDDNLEYDIIEENEGLIEETDKNTLKTEEETDKITEQIKDEILDNCKAEDFFKGLCPESNQTLTTEKKDNMINTIVDNMITGNLKDLLNEIVSGEANDFFIKEDDVIFQITTTDNQRDNEYNNVSTINLGECETVLKEKYDLEENDTLIILKIDYFMEGLLIPIIGYEVFHPKNKSKLNLDYCKDILINYNIPVSINEDEISKYDPNSDYYKDECSTSTSEDGTDMTLNDRQRKYIENNMSLCENKCNFTEYNTSSKKSVCMCEIKSKIYTISEILSSKEVVSKDFNIEEDSASSSSSSLSLMKCYNSLFSKYGLLKNLGNYILLLIIIIFTASCIFFFKVGYVMLCNDIKEILSIKEKTEQDLNIYNYEPKNEIKSKRKRRQSKTKKLSSLYPANPKRKSSIKNKSDLIDSSNTGKESSFHKSFSKFDLRHKKAKSNHLNNINSPITNDKSKDIQNMIMNYDDYELNFFTYKQALEKDKRSFLQYYISLIKAKHPIIFAFVPIKDYNSIITKIGIFLISFGVVYAVNALFFTESTIHQIYKDKGNYNIGYFLPQTFLSFLIAHIVVIILKFIFLTERNILEVKNQETKSKALDKVDNVKRCIIIKSIVFYVSGILFLILFWYYLSSFCAVYQNSQIFLIINAFISSFISLIYPFFINLIPSIIRLFSLSTYNREIFYKTSQIIQII